MFQGMHIDDKDIKKRDKVRKLNKDITNVYIYRRGLEVVFQDLKDGKLQPYNL